LKIYERSVHFCILYYGKHFCCLYINYWYESWLTWLNSQNRWTNIQSQRNIIIFNCASNRQCWDVGLFWTCVWTLESIEFLCGYKTLFLSIPYSYNYINIWKYYIFWPIDLLRLHHGHAIVVKYSMKVIIL
jgi:hypothetical protein